MHITLAPTWFDPAETSGIITPFMVLYALHDALVKPMPGKPMAPSLAESWTQSKDGLVYEFVLRKNVRFHNGDVMTAEDVKFSFARYRGASAALLQGKVARVEVLDPPRIRFTLKQPWPTSWPSTRRRRPRRLDRPKNVLRAGGRDDSRRRRWRGAVQVRLLQAGLRARARGP